MAKKQAKKQTQASMAGPAEKPVPSPGSSAKEPKAKTSARAKAPADAKKPRPQVAERTRFTWPFSKKNLYWFLGAVATIIIGYIFLGQGPYDSFASLTLGPILLVIGYLVLIPVSILVRDKPKS